MRYRTLDVRLWGDEKFRALSPLQPSGQALFLYLLTNPNTTTIPGLYRAGAAAIAEELGWVMENFQKACAEILMQGLAKADFKTRLIFIPNAIKYNKPQSPNVVKSWASHWDELPECELKNIAYHTIKSFLESMGKAFVEAFQYATEKPCMKAMPNQEQDQEQEQTENIGEVKTSPDVVSESVSPNSTQEIFKYWQTVMNHPKAKLDKKRRSRLEAAFKMGYSAEELKQAIDGCFKTPFNQGQNDRGQRYDDIELIFRDASHIDRFIENASNPPLVSTKENLSKDWINSVI